MKKRWWFIIIVLVVIGVLGALALWNTNSEHAVRVATDTVSLKTLVETVRADGKVYPEKEVTLSVEVPGKVDGIYVEEGDSVKAGDLLVTIDGSTLASSVAQSDAGYRQALANVEQAQLRVIQAEQAMQLAKTEYLRSKGLFEKNVIPQAEFLQAEQAWKNAESEWRALQKQVDMMSEQAEASRAVRNEAGQNLQKTRLTAPTAGIVSRLNVELGENVVGTSQMAGTEIVTISDLSRYEVRVNVGENDILKISQGDSVDIEVDAYRNRTFKGTVTKVAYSATQSLTQQTSQFEVRIALASSSYADLIEATNGFPFRPGMSATVAIATDRKEDVPAVPVQAVTLRQAEETEPPREVVFVVEDGRCVEVPVTTGIQDDQYIQILNGVALDKVVVSAPFKAISKSLEDSTAVEVVAKEELYTN